LEDFIIPKNKEKQENITTMASVLVHFLFFTALVSASAGGHGGKKKKHHTGHTNKIENLQNNINTALQNLAMQHQTATNDAAASDARSSYEAVIKAQQAEMKQQALEMVDKLKEQQNLLQLHIQTADDDMQKSILQVQSGSIVPAKAPMMKNKALAAVDNFRDLHKKLTGDMGGKPPSATVLAQMDQVREANPFYSKNAASPHGEGPFNEYENGETQPQQPQPQQNAYPNMMATGQNFGAYAVPNMNPGMVNPYYNNFFAMQQAQQAMLMQQATSPMWAQVNSNPTMSQLQSTALQMQGAEAQDMGNMATNPSNLGGDQQNTMAAQGMSGFMQSSYPYQSSY